MAHSSDDLPAHADFSIIRYAQCWEDADTVLAGLDVHEGDVCLSVGSGGENSLSLLTRAPRLVYAVDVSPAQNACLELKAAGFRVLPYAELLELVGARPSTRRLELYERVRPSLGADARAYWDGRRSTVEHGMLNAGKFERYFALFRRWVLPLIHGRRRVEALSALRSAEARREFYDAQWNTWRWRALFRLFFSRKVMGRLGRDPQFFKYVDGRVAAPIFERTEHALTHLDPSRNPYLQWITCGQFTSALPHAWRPENYEAIRERIDRLEVRRVSVKSMLADSPDASIDRFNLSDIFEYLSSEASDALFADIARCGRRGGRAAYWNMQASRRPPRWLADKLKTLEPLGSRLHSESMTFFYTAFQVEEFQ